MSGLEEKADHFAIESNRNSRQNAITEFFSLTARVRCAPSPTNFEKLPTAKAKTQEQCEPNLCSAVKTKIGI